MQHPPQGKYLIPDTTKKIGIKFGSIKVRIYLCVLNTNRANNVQVKYDSG